MRPGAHRFRRSAEPRGASQPEQAQETYDTGAPGDRLNGPAEGNGQPGGVIGGEPGTGTDQPDEAAAEYSAAPEDDTAAPEDNAAAPEDNAVPAGTGAAVPAEGEPPAPRRKLVPDLPRRAVTVGALGLASVRSAWTGVRARAARPRSDASGRAFARLTVLPAVLVIAWLLPGVPLLLGRAFSPAPMLVISIPLAAAIIVIGLRRVPARWPLSAQAIAGRDGGRPPWWTLAGTLAIAAGFAAWQIVMNSQQLIVTRDQGIYLQFGYWIAQHGLASVPSSLAAFGGPHPGLVFGSLGFIQRGGTLVPQFLAGLPIVLAAGVWAHGVSGALVVAPLLGGLAVLAFGGLTGRLAGARWAPAGALVLALALPEQYTSRSTFGEPLVQILLFGGLCLVIDSLCSPGRQTGGLLVAAGRGGGPGALAGLPEGQEAEASPFDPGLHSLTPGPGAQASDPGFLGPDAGSPGSDALPPGPRSGASGPGSLGPDADPLDLDAGSWGADPGSPGPETDSPGPDPGSMRAVPGSLGPSPHSYWRRRRSFWRRRRSFGPDAGSFGPDPGSLGPDAGSLGPDPGFPGSDPDFLEPDAYSLEPDPYPLEPGPLAHDRYPGFGDDPGVAPGQASAREPGEGAASGDPLTEQTSPLEPYRGRAGGAAGQTAPLVLSPGLHAASSRPGWAAWWRWLLPPGAGRRSRRARKPWAGPGQAAVLAALGGLALGLVAVVRVDAMNALLPVIPLIGILYAARKPQWLPLSLGLLAGVGYGLADGYVLARPYMDSLAFWMRTFGIIAAGVALVTLDAALIMRLAAPRRLVRRVLAVRPLRWLPWGVAALTVLVMIVFAIRPYVQTVRGDTNKSMISYVGYLQRLAGLPLDPGRLYAEDTLYWVIWYIGVPAVLLGTFGMAILARRLTHALVTWRDPGGGARIWGLALLVTGWVTVTVLWRPAVAPDQPWASRRLVTVVIPGLILVAVWTAAWLTSEARQRGAGRPAASAVAAFCVTALLLPTALTTFGVGVAASASPTATSSSAGMALRQTSAGETAAIGRLCAAIGPGASVVILDQRTADRFAQLIRGICDTPTGSMIKPSPFNVQNVIAGILRARRHPVLLGGFRAELESYGATPRQVLDLTTTQDAHELARPPKTTWRIRYVVWMVQPVYG